MNPLFVKEPIKQESEKMGLNLDFFLNGNNKDLSMTTIIPQNGEVTPKKRGRPPKQMSDGNMMVPVEDSNLPQYQSNEPYINTYDETNNLLRGSIVQIDILNNDIKQELGNIRASKTLKGKYTYISDLSGTSGTLLSTKISAIRELNSTITNCHNLEIKRIKELKLGIDETNDDKKIIDMYNAFINAPMGTYAPSGSNLQDAMMLGSINTTGVGGGPDMVRVDISGSGDIGYNNFLANMSPEQNRMILENNPNIETIVVYNQETGQKNFDVIDTSTGQSIQNYPRPTEYLLNNMQINIRAGSARNSDIDQNYKLIVTGNSGSIMDY